MSSKKPSARPRRSRLERPWFHSAELSEQIEQAAVSHEEALRMFQKCQQDSQVLTTRMKRTSRNMAKRRKPQEGAELFPGLRI